MDTYFFAYIVPVNKRGPFVALRHLRSKSNLALSIKASKPLAPR